MESQSQFELFVTSLSGKSQCYKISEADMPLDFSRIIADYGDEKIMVSTSKPEDFTEQFDAKSLKEDIRFEAPPIPIPTDKNSVLPRYSEEKIITVESYYKDSDIFIKGAKPVLVKVDGLNLNFPAFNLKYAYAGLDTTKVWVFPRFPTQKIRLVRFWENTYSTRISGGQTFSRTITRTAGMEKTDEETFSAELGVEVKGLSAKLSYTLKHTLTIKTAVESTESYSIPVEVGQVGIWTLWQLVEKFVFVDENDKLIEWKGNVVGEIKLPGISMFNLNQLPATFIQNNFIHRLPIYDAQLIPFDK